MTTSPLSQLRALEKQKLRLIQSAKDELLDKIHRDLETLNELGFNYTISEPNNRNGADTEHSGGRPCSICGFETEKPHDARSHRWQKPKAPFSEKELHERNMRRV